MTTVMCKGALVHGTACGLCAKCDLELSSIKGSRRPVITEELLNLWEAHVESDELREIVKLARVGYSVGNWTLSHSKAITEALQAKMITVPMGTISKFEKALDSRPKEIR